jgi:pyridoxamine 5'-phosphate oxidase
MDESVQASRLEQMRRHYVAGGLDERDLLSDPIEQFRLWFEQAVRMNVGEWFEPNAMTLATATAGGVPSARVVLLKSFDEKGFVFFTNYASDKGRELTENPLAALVFYWPAMERQVRVTGRVTGVSREQSEAYFRTRPRGSQLGAAVAQQSERVESREALEQRLAELDRQYAAGDVPMPATWGGYCVAPQTIEFWQGRANRLHDRIRFTRQADGVWKIERLAP